MTNGWMDQDETWSAARPRPGPWPHCPSSPSTKGHNPQFSAHICCGQIAGWIKVPLGMEVGLGPGDFVLMGIQLPSPKRGQSPYFRLMSIVAKRLDVSRCHLVCRYRSQPGGLCVRWGPSSPSTKTGQSPLPDFRPMSIVAKLPDASRWHLAWRRP